MRNRKLRIEFAVNHLKKDQSWWNDVIFLDESKYNLCESDGRVMVWRKPNTELRPQNLKPTVKPGGEHVMMWSCISLKSVGNLEFIQGAIQKLQDFIKKTKNWCSFANILLVAFEIVPFALNTTICTISKIIDWLF